MSELISTVLKGTKPLNCRNALPPNCPQNEKLLLNNFLKKDYFFLLYDLFSL